MPLLINGECVSRHIWMHACSICVNTGRAHACVCIVYTCLRISDICVCLVVSLITHHVPYFPLFYQTWKCVSRRYRS